MEPGDKRWFTGQVDQLAINFRQPVGPALYEAMWTGLEDISRANVETAIKRAIRECEYMPVVATLRELAGHGKREPMPEYYKSAEAELERIETCRFHRTYGGPKELNPDGSVPWCRKCKRVMKALGYDKPPEATPLTAAPGDAE